MNSVSPVAIVEVGPRDGLQNQSQIVSTQHKAEFVLSLVAAGVTRIEVASFVDPRMVSQMADAEGLVEMLGDHDGTSFIGVVLNERGAARAVATGFLDEINYVVPVTDSFGQANQGVTTDQAIRALNGVQSLSRDAGLRLSVTLAVAFGCPYEGVVSLQRFVAVAERVVGIGIDELAVADTIGCAVPSQVIERLGASAGLTDSPLRAHFHETRRTGLANAQAALDVGVRALDASAAGLGGCPFAPGAAGNVATEDLVWMLERSGVQTGLDISAITEAGRTICGYLGVEPLSAIAQAGPFPSKPKERSGYG